MADVRTARFELPGFGGELVHPGDAGYDDSRSVFNGMTDRKPALIARCTSADDVAAAVNVARDQDLPLSVYGGGHGVTGSAVVDAGICIDLRGMKGVAVDADARTCAPRPVSPGASSTPPPRSTVLPSPEAG